MFMWPTVLCVCRARARVCLARVRCYFKKREPRERKLPHFKEKNAKKKSDFFWRCSHSFLARPRRASLPRMSAPPSEAVTWCVLDGGRGGPAGRCGRQLAAVALWAAAWRSPAIAAPQCGSV